MHRYATVRDFCPVLGAWGMWFGIVHRRWNLFGSVTFISAQTTVVVAAVLILVWADAWSGVSC
jgi:hypothetical protein